MNELDRVNRAVEEIWKDKAFCDDPSVYAADLAAVDRTRYLESAGKFGTPQYLLEADSLRQRARFFLNTLRGRIPSVEAFYAFKCNDLPALTAILKEEGFQADVAGGFELELALRMGFDRIIFSGPGKSREELDLALKNSHRVVVNVDNFDELERVKQAASSIKTDGGIAISLRVNPNPAGTGAWHKFGFPLFELERAFQSVPPGAALKIRGLHFHSSWNSTPQCYATNIATVGEYLRANLPKETASLEFLDIGGGFYPEHSGVLNQYSLKADIIKAVRYQLPGEPGCADFKFDPCSFALEEVDPLDDFARAIARSLADNIEPLNPRLRIFLEPGRFIAFHSTSILATVTAVKEGCVITDAGINLVGDYRFEEQFFAPILNLSRPSSELNRCTVYGPLCDPYDLWGYSYYGKGIGTGDVLAILHQGAYTYSCAWRFIKPTAPYVMLHQDQLQLVKQVETFEQRYAGCELP